MDVKRLAAPPHPAISVHQHARYHYQHRLRWFNDTAIQLPPYLDVRRLTTICIYMLSYIFFLLATLSTPDSSAAESAQMICVEGSSSKAEDQHGSWVTWRIYLRTRAMGEAAWTVRAEDTAAKTREKMLMVNFMLMVSYLAIIKRQSSTVMKTTFQSLR
ncbi:hypothetical protein JR316_0009373 [Psilocybe cubensis]|uniref:Uncharacterized protein n=1 Tax=Psilocybe cubensis TaxID=181762 RepID=A0ACB8GTC6_PSICU|nr:hypothetical protein JR316_0009373 [Psilocybe cubensis]KAH9478911.1 hypothetical protein JR316_0009373 [Psilocybe cubensis]